MDIPFSNMVTQSGMNLPVVTNGMKNGEFMRILFGMLIFWMSSAACAQTSQKPFTITLKTDKPQVQVGDGVYLTVTMTNTSDHDIDCSRDWSNALDRNYIYNVIDEYGQVPIIEKQYHGGSRLSLCIIKPGETSIPSGGLISRIFDFNRPGKYTIQVSRGVWGDNNRPGTAGTGDNNQGFIKSNTITITVLPAESKPVAEIEPAEGSLPSADEPSSETTKQPFSIKINAGHSHVKVGDPVYVGIEMRNTSDHEIDCTAMTGNNGIDRNFQYEVFDEYGAHAPKIAAGKTFPEAIPCTLKPENNYSTGGEISRIFDFSRPGKYTIQLSRLIWGNDQIPGTGRTVQSGQAAVKSNKITVTILPAESKEPEEGK